MNKKYIYNIASNTIRTCTKDEEDNENNIMNNNKIKQNCVDQKKVKLVSSLQMYLFDFEKNILNLKYKIKM